MSAKCYCLENTPVSGWAGPVMCEYSKPKRVSSRAFVLGYMVFTKLFFECFAVYRTHQTIVIVDRLQWVAGRRLAEGVV